MNPLSQDGRPMHSRVLYAALGLNPKEHLPDDGLMPGKDVNGVRVYVLPKGWLFISLLLQSELVLMGSNSKTWINGTLIG